MKAEFRYPAESYGQGRILDRMNRSVDIVEKFSVVRVPLVPEQALLIQGELLSRFFQESGEFGRSNHCRPYPFSLGPDQDRSS